VEALDRVLGFAEFFLVGVSLIWLCIAAGRARRRGLLGATVLAAVLAVTVAQPFGVVARRASPPTGATTVDHPTHVHIVHAAGIPIAPFRLYARGDLLAGWAENSPTATVRARSWLWLPVLTNSAQVASMCDNSDLTPCWDDEFGDRLVALRKGGSYWVTFASRDTETSPFHLNEELGVWKLGFGLASWAGLAYWALAWALSLLGWRRVRRRA
jgi:hypothetical protein